MQRKIIWSLVILAITYLLIYTFYLNEYWSYKDAMKSIKSYEIKTYLDKYPDGRYTKEVELKLDSVSYFKDVLADSSTTSIEFYLKYLPNGKHTEDVHFIDLYKRPNLPKANEFIKTYNNSSKKEAVEQIINLLWDNEIDHFKMNIGREDISSAKVDFFLNLLLYMKSVNNNNFVIKFNHTTKLKDFSDYPKSNIQLLNLFLDIPPNNQNVFSLKSNFEESNILNLENSVSSEIENSIIQVFSPDFFTFEIAHSNDEYSASESDIAFLIDYKIKNQELSDGFPELWTYEENHIFKGYLLGIDVSFSLNLKNPGNNKSLSFEEKGDPGTEISDMNDFTSAYAIMVSRSFNTFVNKITKDIGLTKKD